MLDVRTSHRDGGGAYLLLDGSRAMTGDLDLSAPVRIKWASDMFFDRIGSLQIGLRNDAGNALRIIQSNLSTNIIAYVNNAGQLKTRNTAAAVVSFIGRATEAAKLIGDPSAFEISRGGDIALLSGKILSGLGDVRAPNLPTSDPADGNSKLWNNSGVVTVGT